MTKIEKILLFVIIILLSLILFGTIFVFVSGNAIPAHNLRKIETTTDTLEELHTRDTAYYSQLGTLRCKTKDQNPIALVVNISFEYPTNDIPFYEEIFRKNKKLTIVIIDYFESYTKAELLEKGETKIKSDITTIINSELVLGKIERIYLTEYIFLE